MLDWIRRRRDLLMACAMAALAIRIVCDGLAALHLIPPLGQNQASALLLFALVAGLSSGQDRHRKAPPNWIARHRRAAYVIGVAIVSAMVWLSIGLERHWHTALAGRLIIDLLAAAAIGFWVRERIARKGPLAPA